MAIIAKIIYNPSGVIPTFLKKYIISIIEKNNGNTYTFIIIIMAFNNLRKKIFNFPKRVIESIENCDVPLLYFLLTFIFIVALRNFLEYYSDRWLFNFINHIHYTIFYFSLVSILILIFNLSTKEKIEKIIKVIVPFFIIINLGPILDLIISGGQGFNISYLLPDVHGNIIVRFLTFFGEFTNHGVTPGIKIEIGIALSGCFVYFYTKTSKLIKSLIFIFFTYLIIFSFMSFPYIIKLLLDIINIPYIYSDDLLLKALALVFFIGFTFIFYLYDKKLFSIIVKDIRPFRLIHFELMFFLGFIIGLQIGQLQINCINIFNFILLPMSICFAWIFSVMTNNLEDIAIDKISNKQRPLIKSNLNIKRYKSFMSVFLFLSILYSAIVSYNALVYIILFIGNYFLYSMPPLRLKRVPIFSKFIIAINSFIIFLAGFSFISEPLDNIPVNIIFIFLIGFTLCINFIDLKDYNGDKKANIKSLPVLLGLKKSKLLIGIFFLLTYLSVYFEMKKIYILIPLSIFGVSAFIFINRKNYNEKPVFISYLISIIALITYYLFFY